MNKAFTKNKVITKMVPILHSSCDLSELVCACVSVSDRAVTFEAVDTETSFLVWCYIVTISRSSLSAKVIGSRSNIRKCLFN